MRRALQQFASHGLMDFGDGDGVANEFAYNAGETGAVGVLLSPALQVEHQAIEQLIRRLEQASAALNEDVSAQLSGYSYRRCRGRVRVRVDHRLPSVMASDRGDAGALPPPPTRGGAR